MLIRTDTLQPWDRKRLADGILYPRNIEELWSDAALLAIGLVTMTPKAMPDGHRRTGPSTYGITGQEDYPTELIPPPTLEEIAEDRENETVNILDKNPILGRILFYLAKETRPSLTREQFATWIRGLA